MIKGCNKRVIVMKDTGNAMVEEAIFILKPGSDKSNFSENDIIKHANTILDKNSYNDRFSQLSFNVTKPKKSGKLTVFLWGVSVGALTVACLFMLL